MLSTLDWTVLIGTLLAIVAYGVYKTRGTQSVKDYLLGGNDSKWWTIGLSVMATQASAITFLSTPGQAYSDGMGFVQIYFGLPLALIVVCVFFIPLYYKLKVYTAYEYLESRFDVKTRTLAAIYFLIQRGMGAGITIFAPAIILSSILGWNLNYTILVIGLLVIIYTVLGGTKAVNQTQKLQMVVIMGGMAIAFILILGYLPDDLSFSEVLHVAGASGKMDVVDFSFDMNNRYTIWSGVLGGFFLSLAYFGTDQSQVQRYLGGQSVKQSRLGLLFNALLKVPMQFFILLTGVLVFVFFQYNKAPVFFNTPEYAAAYETHSQELDELQSDYDVWFDEKQVLNDEYLQAIRVGNTTESDNVALRIQDSDASEKVIRNNVKTVIAEARPDAETNDKDYVFITFILNYMPIGIIGLLLAVIFSAAMSSTAAELNALGSTTTVDIYRRSLFKNRSEEHYVWASKGMTMLWGVIAILFALVGSLFENLIQFVNIIGSLFYGTMLGFFIVAFAFKWIKNGTAVFIAAIIAEAVVLSVYMWADIGYLWYNLIGSVGVILFSIILQSILPKSGRK